MILRSTYVTDRGLQLLADGGRQFGRVARLVDDPRDHGDLEGELRRALRTLRSAMNWLEDTEEFETAHQRLDAAGRLARESFPSGCRYLMKDGAYFQECPVALAHNRVGLSPGILVRKSECSICHSDPEDCDHITGRTYDGERCIRVITDAEILEVSLVGRPASPDARLESVSVPADELQSRLGSQFVPGMPAPCDRCLGECRGVARPFEGSGHGVPLM